MDDLRAAHGLSLRWALTTLAAVVAIAGCGAATVATTSPPSSSPSSQSVTAPATASPTAAPPSSTAPPPLPPLALLQRATLLQAVDAAGHSQWSVSIAEINKLVSTDPNNYAVIRGAGNNVFVFADHWSKPAPGSVVVLDRTGKVLGSGSFDVRVWAHDVGADPSGTQWAWSVDDGALPSGQHHGRIMVAGLGIPKHQVYGWVAPVGAWEAVGGWTDMGIVMERLVTGGCGAGFLGDSASFLIDPTTGALTDLFSGAHYLDARHGARVARALDSESDVIINGMHYDEPGTTVFGAYASPDGSLVGIARLTPVSCTGARQPKLGTELVTVATQAHVDLSACLIAGWFDTTHYACRSLSSAVLTLDDLRGATTASLGNADFVGVLQGPS